MPVNLRDIRAAQHGPSFAEFAQAMERAQVALAGFGDALRQTRAATEEPAGPALTPGAEVYDPATGEWVAVSALEG